MTKRRPSRPAVPVTDHAVLRYLERVQGWDIEAVRREIAAIAAPAVRMGACGITRDGWSFRISDGTVITVLDAAGGGQRHNGREDET